uniref:hypothetical protein n=1 Tax=Staphylococcus aureus TaxID=1280 RepID=UPI00210C538B
NQANVVDIGAIWSKVSGGYLKTSGTQVQPGGFMAAARMDINAERIKAVNDAFQIRKADGSVDREASDALVAQLKANLGLDYTSSTVEDDIHQDFVKEKKGLPTFVVMALAVAASVMTAGAASAAMGVAMANMTIGQAMMTAALSS